MIGTVGNNPFKLLDAFTREDLEVFFGREREVEEMHARLLRERITIVYGASGTGKTSLVQCGLASRFTDADWLPVFVRRGTDLLVSARQAVRKAALTTLPDDASLAKAVKSLYLDHFKPVYLVLDQFEEAFVFGTKEERATFLSEIRSTLALDGNVRVVIVIREEYFAHLTELEELEPSLLENRMRLERMTRGHAIEVVEGSCRATGVGLEPGLAPLIVGKVFPAGREIELAHLQIFLDRLWRRAAVGAATVDLTRDLLEKEGRLGDVLGDFLDQQIRQMPDPDSAMAVLKVFVSREGTRARATAAEAMAFTEALGRPLSAAGTRDILNGLVARRLLREQEDDGAYELSHDSLAARVYSGISHVEKELLEVRQMVLGRFEEARRRSVLLSAEDLTYLAPFENRLYLSGPVRAFVAASRHAHAAQEDRKKRRARIALSGVVGLLAIVTAVVSYLAVAARRSERNATQLRRRFLFTQATERVDRGRTDEAIAYLCAASRLGDSAASDRLMSLLAQRSWCCPRGDLQKEDYRDLVALMEFPLAHESFSLLSEDGTKWLFSALSGRFSPDCRRVLSVFDDRTARVWDAESGVAVTEPTRHSGRISSARFSPDGARFVTASWDGAATIWDSRTGQQVGQPLRHDGPVDLAEFSPDGTRVVTLSKSLVRIWDAASGALLSDRLLHLDVRAARFSRDGRKLVTTSMGYAVVWDALTGRVISEPMSHEPGQLTAAFNSDATKVATASEDGTARIWDALTGRPLSEPLRHEGAVSTAEFSLDGARLVTASEDRTARVWDVSSGKPILEPLRHGGPVLAALFGTQGGVVTASANASAKAWEARIRGGASQMGRAAHVKFALFDAGGRRIVWSSWDAAAPGEPTAKQIAAPSLGSIPRIWPFNATGTRAVLSTDGGEGVVEVYDTATGTRVGPPLVHDERIFWNAQLDAGGTRVLTSSHGAVVVRDVRSGKPLFAPLRHGKSITFAAFSHDGTRIVTAADDRSVRIWDAVSGAPLSSAIRHPNNVYFARLSPDGTKVLTISGDTVRLWDVHTTLNLTQPIQVRSEFTAFGEFAPDGKSFAVSSDDGTVTVHSVPSGAAIGEPMRHERSVRLRDSTQTIVQIVRFAPDGKHLLTASDRKALTWNVTAGRPSGEPMVHEGFIYSAEYSMDGARIVTTSEDRTARVWDAETGRALSDPLRHEGNVLFGALTADSRAVVTLELPEASSRGDSLGPRWRSWDLGAGLPNVPPWFLELAETIGGAALTDSGLARTIPLENRIEVIDGTDHRLRQGGHLAYIDPYVKLARRLRPSVVLR